MRKRFLKLAALVLAGSMVLTVPTVSVSADTFAAGAAVTVGVAGNVSGVPVLRLDFTEDDWSWLKAIQEVRVGDTIYERDSYINMLPSASTWYAEEGFDYSSYRSTYYLRLTNDLEDTTDFVVSAEGYEDVTIHVEKGADGSYTAAIAGNVTEPVVEEETPEEPTAKKPIAVSQASLSVVSGRWVIGFTDADDYVSTIESLSVNGVEWTAQDYDPYTGGKYFPKTDTNQIKMVATSWTVQDTGILQSGDVIRITSSDYEDLEMKFVTDGSTAELVENDGRGDIYQLYVKLKGTFASAISGQKEYDAVSAATGMSSTTKNSDVQVFATVGERDTEPEEESWQELGTASDVQIDSNSAKVVIAPDTSKGTPADSDSGLEGIYFTMDSGLTLIGSPKDPGYYLVSVSMKDAQGRESVSNGLPLRIYSGKESLSEMLVEENLTQTADGKFMWKNMEPWTITTFGSNVDGEAESVRIPAGLKAWYGSSESGLYGNLGYAIPWSDVQRGNIPQTLYIPAGCDLTFVNMELQSSVKIVVESGAKLTLRDSVVQGIIDVQNGGTFSMNYNGFGGSGEFLTGASVDGQIILEDGAVIENAAVVSHANYIANGDINDRTTADAVVVAKGNVTVQGQVFIAGDEAGSNPNIGQTGLQVDGGTVTVGDGSTLAVYGGAGKVTLNGAGGTAVVLNGGTITGNGKLVALGGAAQYGNGGNAVRGSGTISTKDVYLQGGATRESTMLDGASGKGGAANPDGITLQNAYRTVTDGSVIALVADDPNEALYWNVGVDATPNLDVYTVEEVKEETPAEEPTKDDPKAEEPGTVDPSQEDPKTEEPGSGEVTPVDDKTDPAVTPGEDPKQDPTVTPGNDQKTNGRSHIVVVVRRCVQRVATVVRNVIRSLFGWFR